MSAEHIAAAKHPARRSAAERAEGTAGAFRPQSARHANHVKDEVYREMLRLEAGRAGAEMGLALALLRAAAQREDLAADAAFSPWLAQVLRLGLEMIESSLKKKQGLAQE